MITLELGTPTVALMHTWQYDEPMRASREILVPAYVFPILNKPADYWQSSVAIPLIKDVFSNRYEKPMPLPMGAGGAESGVVRSTDVISLPAVKE